MKIDVFLQNTCKVIAKRVKYNGKSCRPLLKRGLLKKQCENREVTGMSKGLGLLIIGGLAVIGGAVFAALLIRNKILRDEEDDFDEFDDFDDFDYDDDPGFENYFGEGSEFDKTDDTKSEKTTDKN